MSPPRGGPAPGGEDTPPVWSFPPRHDLARPHRPLHTPPAGAVTIREGLPGCQPESEKRGGADEQTTQEPHRPARRSHSRKGARPQGPRRVAARAVRLRPEARERSGTAPGLQKVLQPDGSQGKAL